jgi:hypothetical protein
MLPYSLFSMTITYTCRKAGMAFVAVAEGEGKLAAAEVVAVASVAMAVGIGEPWAEPAGADVPAAIEAPAGVMAGDAHAAIASAATIVAAAIPASARLFRAGKPIEGRMGLSMRDNRGEMRSGRKLSLRPLDLGVWSLLGGACRLSTGLGVEAGSSCLIRVEVSSERLLLERQDGHEGDDRRPDSDPDGVSDRDREGLMEAGHVEALKLRGDPGEHVCR